MAVFAFGISLKLRIAIFTFKRLYERHGRLIPETWPTAIVQEASPTNQYLILS
jgi:hypothetical protein